MAHMCSAQGPGQALHLGGVRPGRPCSSRCCVQLWPGVLRAISPDAKEGRSRPVQMRKLGPWRPKAGHAGAGRACRPALL